MILRLYLTFGQDIVKKPLIWQLAKEFDIVTNIRTAEVKEDMGLVGLEMDGESGQIEAAVRWLQEQGVHVEPIEQSVIAG
ncbi:MAG: NIL domain-containing protein [Mariprofundaceae bacterium]